MLTNLALQKYTGMLGDVRKVGGNETRPAIAEAVPAADQAQETAPGQQAEPVTRIPSLDSQAFESAVKDITEEAQNLQRSLQFHVDEESGRTIITVIDKQTEEIIRQIPPEEVLSLAEQFRRGGGLFVETEA
ncbi:MAG: flagellar protein FlaG [Gammaproteobacteria bacterium]